MPTPQPRRGIPGEGYLVTTPRGTVYRVPLPKAPGETRARYRERTVPPHLLTGRRAALDAWQRDTRAQLLAEHAAATNPPPAPETVGQFLTHWLADLPPTLAPSTIAARRTIITRHLIPAIGEVPLAELTPRRIETMLRAIDLAPATVAGIRSVLVQALNDAVRLELLTRNPATLARGPARPRVHRPRLDAAGVRSLVAAADGERLGTLILVAAALGLRRGELLGLRWADIDLTAGTLRVAVQRQREPGPGKPSVERPPKAGSARTIPLPASLVSALTAHRDRQRWEQQQPGYQDHGLVFAQPDGRPTYDDLPGRLLRQVLVRAGLPAMRLHDLRGSAASVLLGLGVPLPSVMAILGHRKASTTLEVYAAALPEGLAAAARTLDQALSMDTSMDAATSTETTA